MFTDIEGSTKLLDELGSEGYELALASHRAALCGLFDEHGGVEVETGGDSFFVAFGRASDALAAAGSEVTCRLRDQHLPAVTGSSGPVHVDPDISLLPEQRLARVHADPHTSGRPCEHGLDRS